MPSCAWPHEAEIRARLCECLQLCSVAGLNQAKLCLLGSGRSKTLSVRVCFRGLYPSESGSGAYYGNIPNVRPHYVGLRSSKPGLSLSSHFLCWVNSHPKGLAWLGPFRSLKYCLLLHRRHLLLYSILSFFLTDSFIRERTEVLHYTLSLL